jgi:hypothetical protein
VSYRLVFTGQAQRDAKKISRSGLKKNVGKLLTLLEENPYQSPAGRAEPLEPNGQGPGAGAEGHRSCSGARALTPERLPVFDFLPYRTPLPWIPYTAPRSRLTCAMVRLAIGTEYVEQDT